MTKYVPLVLRIKVGDSRHAREGRARGEGEG